VNDESATERNFKSPRFSVFPGWGISSLEPCQTPNMLEAIQRYESSISINKPTFRKE
jgi:hypothetical protein